MALHSDMGRVTPNGRGQTPRLRLLTPKIRWNRSEPSLARSASTPIKIIRRKLASSRDMQAKRLGATLEDRTSILMRKIKTTQADSRFLERHPVITAIKPARTPVSGGYQNKAQAGTHRIITTQISPLIENRNNTLSKAWKNHTKDSITHCKDR